MKIITITEEDYGLIGAVKKESLILPWLVRKNWLNQFTRIYDTTTNKWKDVKELYGLNWYQVLSALSTDDLCELLDGVFYFDELEVWEG